MFRSILSFCLIFYSLNLGAISQRPCYSNSTFVVKDEKIAELKYYGKIPVLMIYTEDPHLRGQAMCNLTFEQTHQFLTSYTNIMTSLVQLLSWHIGFQNPIDRTLKKIKTLQLYFPDDVIEEMKGIQLAYNYLLQEKKKNLLFFSRKPIKLDYLKAITAFPDVYKGFACSAALRKVGNSVQFYRNLDWPSLGILGKTSLVIVRPVTNPRVNGPKSLFSVTFPPGHLALSMGNDKGLIITINEACNHKSKRNHEKGIPEALMIREIVKNCSTVEEVKDFLNVNPPASSHILTVRDRTGKAAIFQMLPKESDHFYDILDFNYKRNYLHVTNHFINEQGNCDKETTANITSKRRYKKMEMALRKGTSNKEVLKSVNVLDTVQAMIFRENEQGELLMDLNFSNKYAATGIFQTLNLTKLFDQLEKS